MPRLQTFIKSLNKVLQNYNRLEVKSESLATLADTQRFTESSNYKALSLSIAIDGLPEETNEQSQVKLLAKELFREMATHGRGVPESVVLARLGKVEAFLRDLGHGGDFTIDDRYKLSGGPGGEGPGISMYS